MTVWELRPRSHHKGATCRVRTGDQRYPVLCHCQLRQDIPEFTNYSSWRHCRLALDKVNHVHKQLQATQVMGLSEFLEKVMVRRACNLKHSVRNCEEFPLWPWCRRCSQLEWLGLMGSPSSSSARINDDTNWHMESLQWLYSFWPSQWISTPRSEAQI